MSAEENQEYDERKLFVGGLSWDTTEVTLRDYFSQFGEVIEVSVKRDKNSEKPRGFGFVKFKDESGIRCTLEKSFHELDGKKIDPKLATAKSGKPAKVFVGGIPPLVDGETLDDLERELRILMEEDPHMHTKRKVNEVEIKKGENKDRHRGFGFVTFMRAEDAQEVCRLKYFLFKGKNIEVKVADARTTKQGGGFSGGQMYYQPHAQPHQHQQWDGSTYQPSGSYGYGNSSDYNYYTQSYQHPQSGSSAASQMTGYDSYSYPHGSTQADTGAAGGYSQGYQQPSYAYTGHQSTGHTTGYGTQQQHHQQQQSSYFGHPTSQPHHH